MTTSSAEVVACAWCDLTEADIPTTVDPESIFKTQHTGVVLCTGCAGMPTRPCARCEGEGQVANTDEGEPWSAWDNLPESSKLGIRAGIIYPVPCPACRGHRVVPL